MQEFWVTVTRHHSSLRFKLDGKSHTVNVDNFRDMLKIFPKLPGQKLEEPPLEEDILSFIRDLGHTGEIKFLSDVNVNHMHQPWRSFAAIINKCLSGKTTALESLRLSYLVFQVENKNSKKNNDMYYPRFTKVIVDYFMEKDQAILRRNKMFWHYARDDFMFTTIKSEAFKTYHAYATGEKAPKSKATKKKTDSESSPKTNPSQASKGKRIKTSAKGDKPATTKSKGLTVLSEVALSEAEQMKLETKRSLTEFHVSHASGSGDGVDLQSKVPDEQQQIGFGTNEGAGDKPEVLDVFEYRSESEEESWTFSQGEDEEKDEEHDSDDDNDDNDDEYDDQENDSQRTESDDEGDDFVYPNLSTYLADDQEKEKEKADDDDDDVTSDQKVPTPPDYELTEEDENQQDDDTMGEEQGDEDNGELYKDLNIYLIVQLQISSASLETWASSLESNLSELKQTNQFAEVLSSILGIVDKYLATKVKDTVDVAVQLKSDKLREEAQAENQDFLNSLDSNMKRIIKEQVKAQTSKIMTKVEKYVTETLGAEVLVRSTNQPQTSYAVASSLSELELKKILMDKMEENNSIDRSDVQKNLYRALLEAYNSDKDLLSSYGEVVTLKRGRDDQDKDEEPSAGSNRGSKRQRSGKEESSKEATQKESKSTSSSKGTTRSPPKSSGKSVQEEEHDPRVDDLEEPFHQEFDTGNDDVSPVREATDVDERLWNPSGSRTPDQEWNQTKTVDDRPPQQWMTKLAQASGTTSSFNEFLATPIDFSAFIMNRLNIQHLTQDLLTGPTYDLIKGTCKSVVELEYHLEEVFKATNDQLDWHNPEGRPYPHDLSKPLPLIPDARGRLIIPYDHFINNDLEYLKGESSSHKYTTSITKTKATDYGHIKWIEDKIPRSTWSEAQVKRSLQRQDDKLYKFREGDFKRLRREDIEDMLLLLVQGKLTNLNVDERFALNVALRMYTRRIVIQERVDDLQLVVEIYQKKINLIKPDTYHSDISKNTPYTAYHDIQSIIYQDDMNRNRLMRTEELHKFSDDTLNHVRTSLNDIV
ncbi:hypothetical protein Tco_0401109 [Tanacetum coccineum]